MDEGKEMVSTPVLPDIEYAGEIDLDAAEVFDRAPGRRVTNADIDRWNDGEDRRNGLIPGGKSLTGRGAHSPVLRVVLSESSRDKVVAAAAAENMSVSRWLRRTVEDRLSHAA